MSSDTSQAGDLDLPCDIVLFGDAWVVGYVVPKSEAFLNFQIRYTGGGILLLNSLLEARENLPEDTAKEDSLAGKREGFKICVIPGNNAAKQVKLASVHRICEYGEARLLRASEPKVAAATLVIDEFTFERPVLPAEKNSEWGSNDHCRVFVDRISDLGNEKDKTYEYAGSREFGPCEIYLRDVSLMLGIASEQLLNRPVPKMHVRRAVGAIMPASLVASETHLRLNSSYESLVSGLIAWIRSKTGKEDNFSRIFGSFRDLTLPKEGAPGFVVFILPGSALLLYWRSNCKQPGQEPSGTGACDGDYVALLHDHHNAAHVECIGAGKVRWRSALVAAILIEELLKILRNKAEIDERVLTGALELALEHVIAYERIGMSFLRNEPTRGPIDLSAWRIAIEKDRLESIEAWKRKDPKAKPVLLHEPCIQHICSPEILWTMAGSTLASLRRSPTSSALWKAEEPKDLLDICEAGAKQLLCGDARELFNCMPLVRFKEQTLIDREEIEDYLAIQSALLTYIGSRPSRPLNLGVFGPPGSGKSFGTKELLKHIGDGSGTFQAKPCEFNLAQFRSVGDLAEALHIVRNEGLSGSIPVAFFDEFDSPMDGNQYGWLQYLLAPMQDGVFWDRNQLFTLGKCVLVFAGGVNRRFEEMNGRLRDPQFCSAKGPDFISRLRGVLNIRAVNRPENAERDSGRYLLRRAVVLRSIIERLHKEVGARLPQKYLSQPLARAFIGVDGFKHGARSMEAILRMSRIKPGETMVASDLPILYQLEMHVDAKRFLELIREEEMLSGKE